MKEGLESAIKHNCSLLSENKLCIVVDGKSHPFDYKNHTRCENPGLNNYHNCQKYQMAKTKILSLLSGSPFNIEFL